MRVLGVRKQNEFNCLKDMKLPCSKRFRDDEEFTDRLIINKSQTLLASLYLLTAKWKRMVIKTIRQESDLKWSKLKKVFNQTSKLL